MDPGAKLGVFLIGFGAVAGLGWFGVRKLFGPPPPADPTGPTGPEGSQDNGPDIP